MAKRQNKLPSGYIPFPETFASGHILCHRKIGEDALIKIIAYRDQINTEYEPMPGDSDGPEGSESVDLRFEGPQRFLARFKLSSIVMTIDTAQELRDGLEECIKRAKDKNYIDEE